MLSGNLLNSPVCAALHKTWVRGGRLVLRLGRQKALRWGLLKRSKDREESELEEGEDEER